MRYTVRDNNGNVVFSIECIDPSKSEEFFGFGKKNKKENNNININKPNVNEIKHQMLNCNEFKNIKNLIPKLVNASHFVHSLMPNFCKYYEHILHNPKYNGKYSKITNKHIESCIYNVKNNEYIENEILEELILEYNIKSVNDLDKIKTLRYRDNIFDSGKFVSVVSDLYPDEKTYEDISTSDDLDCEKALFDYADKYIKNKIKPIDIGDDYSMTWEYSFIELVLNI